MKGLQHDPDMITAKQGKLVFIQLVQALPGNFDPAGGLFFKSAHQRHETRFAGTGRTQYGDGATTRDFKVDAIQNIDFVSLALKFEMYVLKFEYNVVVHACVPCVPPKVSCSQC